MKIDQAKLKKWEEVVQFASDPERLSMLEMVLDKNGTGPNGVPSSARSEPKPVPFKRWKEGTQIGAIADAAMQSEQPFSGYDLAAKMQQSGHKFTVDNPGLRVTDVLRTTLREKGVVRVFRKGRGSEPMLFERVL
jgi:hypothetical protein